MRRQTVRRAPRSLRENKLRGLRERRVGGFAPEKSGVEHRKSPERTTGKVRSEMPEKSGIVTAEKRVNTGSRRARGNPVAAADGDAVAHDVAVRQVRDLREALLPPADLERPFPVHHEVARPRVGDTIFLANRLVDSVFVLATGLAKPPARDLPCTEETCRNRLEMESFR